MRDGRSVLRAATELIAGGVSVTEVLETVAGFAAELLGATHVAVLRLATPSEVEVEVAWAATGAPSVVLDRWSLADDPSTRHVIESGRAVRETWEGATDPVGRTLRGRLGVRSSVGVPISVDDHVWGALYVHTTGEELGADAEECLAAFSQLIAAAIVNAATRAELERVVLEQEALRRVAGLVAKSAEPMEVFDAVAEELARLLRVQGTKLLRYETDGTATFVASWGPLDGGLVTGTRISAQGTSVAGRILATGEAARVDDYRRARGPLAEQLTAAGIRSAAGAPIRVDGRLWGAIVIGTADRSLPDDTEQRMRDFADLVATAIANLESRRALLDSRVRLVHMADDTRRRFERDLHDGVQQRLVAVGLGVVRAQGAVAEDEPAREILDAVGVLLDDTIDGLRELSRGVHPAILTEGGLAPALRSLARRSGIATDLTVGDLGRLDAHVEVAAYFVVSEGLTNTAKHAPQAKADVVLGLVDDGLRIEVRDDGRGGADPEMGSGLIGIADRVEALGGSIEILSPVGRGTTITVVLPTGRRD
nr:GAF domain-containing protein [Herbiconiux sp. VKM Ac-1786]